MKIEFIGGARTVTGSAFLIKDDDFTIQVDCGMFQGKRELRDRNYLDFNYDPGKIDALLLTHAHIDHSGLVPKLVKNGFYGNIYATKATADLCSIMLPDSAHIQEMDVKWINKKNKKLGREEVEPLYNMEDAEKAIKNFAAVDYGEIVQVHPRVKVRFRDAGHILGSAFIEMWVDNGGKETKLVFSGDLGPNDQAIIRDPEVIEEADILLIESTYGNRLHKNKQETYEEFKKIILEAHNNQGNIVIPAFAVERTQEIIYTLGKLIRSKEIPGLDVYIDSPLAISATEIFRKNRQCFDKKTQDILLSGDSPLDFESLVFTRKTEESKRIKDEARGAIIISASGMCTAGRIKFHLRDNLYKKQSSVIFVGYQAEGTLGRRLIEGAKQVKLYGVDVSVKAQIHTLGGFSGHADKAGLLNWMKNIKNPDLKVFVVHGEENAAMSFAKEVKTKTGLNAYVPHWGEEVDLGNLKSKVTTYGKVEPRNETDSEIESLSKLTEELIGKYKNLKGGKKYFDYDSFTNDITDMKEMMKMIIDEI